MTGALDSVMKEKKIEIKIGDVLYQVAVGMEYIHELDFIHRDVAARNVLIDSAKKAKIADFGMSRNVEASNASYKSSGGLVPVRWTSPESLNDAEYSKASDVWAFAIFIHEIFTDCEVPYSSMSNDQVWTKVCSGYRLSRVNKCPLAIYELMLKCWNANPSERPSYTDIRAKVGEVCDVSDSVLKFQTPNNVDGPQKAQAAVNEFYTEKNFKRNGCT